jgi:septum formation topological specificity factor MinE
MESQCTGPALEFSIQETNVKQENTKLQELEREKLALIQKYIEIRDLMDSYNEQEYRVCREIERLNVEIERVRREEESARSAQAAAPETAPKKCCGDHDCGAKEK